MKFYRILFCFIAIAIFSCKQQPADIVVTTDDFHHSVDRVTQVMIHDIFSPPVSSRVFVYPNIAAFEIIAKNSENYISLEGQVKDWKNTIKKAPKEVNVHLSALIAHMELSRFFVFTEELMTVYTDSLYDKWKDQNENQFIASKKYALEVVEEIKKWVNKDNYAQTRTMPKFYVDIKDVSRWQPTPPSYMSGIEPHWNKIRTLILDSASQFKPATPPKFSMDKESDFYKELKEVYDESQRITKIGNSSEEIKIAQFWDCNPYVSVVRGHMMFATKKITPGAHWIGICKIAARKSNFDFEETVRAYTETSIAIFEGFISCWDEKYRSNLVRPETLINKFIDEDWKPILQTPPFPEYTSGHSVVSGAASVALTSIFSENFSFDDDTEVPFDLPVRSYQSFYQASSEAAISRMYGGIHYRSAIELGLTQGKEIGKFITKRIKLKK